jgi:putative membrane protein
VHSTPGPVSPRVPHLAAAVAGRLLGEQTDRARDARAGAGPELWLRRTTTTDAAAGTTTGVTTTTTTTTPTAPTPDPGAAL